MTKWTEFYDMCSGGSCKEPPYSKIYIEFPYNKAISYFIDKFGHNPTWTACECCGQNYSIYELDGYPDTEIGEDVLIISQEDMYKEEYNKKLETLL